MTASSLPAIASSLALWPGLLLLAGGLAKAADVSHGDLRNTVLARLVEGRVSLRAAWGLAAAAELVVGVLVLVGILVPWPEAAAAVLLAGATFVAVWGLRNAPDAGCGCFGARTTARAGPRTAVRAGLLAVLAALAAAGGESWWSAVDDLLAVAGIVLVGIALAWLSPELPELRDAAAVRIGRVSPRAERLRAAACSRRITVRRTVARLRRSELWRRARPHLSADEPTEQWDEGCWRMLCYPAVYEGEPATAVFAINLGFGKSRDRVAFVDEAEQRVLGGLEARRSRS